MDPHTLIGGFMELHGAEAFKREAAKKALEHVQSGMALGLGTGSTVAHFLDLLGKALQEGTLRDIVGVPTSIRTTREARMAEIPLESLAERPRLDLAVDGADEVSPGLDLIKGMGGALLREKMVAQASERLIIIGDDSKLVERLGTVSPLPVEVVDWSFRAHAQFMEARGATVVMRAFEDGAPFKSDNGNVILDCTFPGGIEDPEELEDALRARAGVVESGLFLGMTEQAIIAGTDGIRVLEPVK